MSMTHRTAVDPLATNTEGLPQSSIVPASKTNRRIDRFARPSCDRSFNVISFRWQLLGAIVVLVSKIRSARLRTGNWSPLFASG